LFECSTFEFEFEGRGEDGTLTDCRLNVVPDADEGGLLVREAVPLTTDA